MIVGMTSFVNLFSASVPGGWVHTIRFAETFASFVAANYIYKRKYFNITFKIRNYYISNTSANINQITYHDSELRNRPSKLELDA